MARSVVTHPITLNGVTYNLSKFNDISHESLDEWVKSKYVESTMSLMKAMPPEMHETAIKVAYKECATIGWLSAFGAKLASTLPGVARLVYEGARISDPSVKYEDILKNLIDENDVRKANAAFNHLNIPKKKRVRTPPKPQRRSRKGKST